jgi:hypothetical protein
MSFTYFDFDHLSARIGADFVAKEDHSFSGMRDPAFLL